MVIRITRLLLLFQLLIAAGIYFSAIQFLAVGHAYAFLIAAGAVLLARLIITANNFFLAWRHRSIIPDHYRVGPWTTLKLFFQEYYATMVTSSWTMPFRSFTKRVAPAPQGLPVLLVHGYGCNSGYWNSMSKALLNANITHRAVNLEPVIGSIDDYAALIHGAVETLISETGHQKVIIVAHSMGGLATRAYLRDHGSAQVARVVTLGTPHHGTFLAHFGVGVNTQQMRWTATEQEGVASDWLLALKANEDPVVHRLFVSIYSHHDNIISPQTSSHLPGARNIEFHAIGHVALALHPDVQAEVIREIRAASAQVGPAKSMPAQLKPA